jgi:hypothetical protein
MNWSQEVSMAWVSLPQTQKHVTMWRVCRFHTRAVLSSYSRYSQCVDRHFPNYKPNSLFFLCSEYYASCFRDAVVHTVLPRVLALADSWSSTLGTFAWLIEHYARQRVFFALATFSPGTQWIADWVTSRAGLDDVEKGEFLTLPGLRLLPLGRSSRSQPLYRLSCRSFLSLLWQLCNLEFLHSRSCPIQPDLLKLYTSIHKALAMFCNVCTFLESLTTRLCLASTCH